MLNNLRTFSCSDQTYYHDYAEIRFLTFLNQLIISFSLICIRKLIYAGSLLVYAQ
jgi:hypothetical protein